MYVQNNLIPDEFTESKLSAIVSIIADARIGAKDRHDSSFGDDAQVLGMRAYKNFTLILDELQGTEGYEWLRIYSRKGRFTLTIDGIAVRIWRAEDPEQEPEVKRMILSIDAPVQHDLFNNGGEKIDRWGIVYQTDIYSRVLSASLVGYDSKFSRAVSVTNIPVNDIPSIGLYSVKENLPEPVKIEKAATKLRLKANTLKKTKND